MLKNTKILFAIILQILIFASEGHYAQPINENCKVALTFDDLPFARMSNFELTETKEIFKKLISNLKNKKVTAIGFVNEHKLYTKGKIDSLKAEMLIDWLNAGFDLGNHTFSHPDINKVPVEEFIENIEIGETFISQLLNNRGKNIRYFRHPYLHTGLSIEVKNKVDSFLNSKGYIIAPVTIDNSESSFALAYDNAYDKNDSTGMQKIGAEYLVYIDSMFQYFETMSKKYFNRNINQVLLLHSNKLNADYINRLVEVIKNRGYVISSLDEVLKDRAYSQKDEFIGKKGLSWIQRWIITTEGKNTTFPPEPELSDYVNSFLKK